MLPCVAHRPGDPVDPGYEVTHVGNLDGPKLSGRFARSTWRFVCRPRQIEGQPESYVSVYLGRLSLSGAIERIGLGQRPVLADDVVRYGQVQRLLDAGFKVTHEPDACEEHVAVKSEGEWDEEVAKAFDDCFRDYLR